MTTEESATIPEPDPAQAGGRRRVPLVVTGIASLIGAAIGLAIGYVVFDGGSDPADEWSAEVATAHVDYACDITQRISETHPTLDDVGSLGEDPWYYEGIAAGSLITAASHEPQYEHLGELGESAQAAVARIDFERWTEFVDAFLEECG